MKKQAPSEAVMLRAYLFRLKAYKYYTPDELKDTVFHREVINTVGFAQFRVGCNLKNLIRSK